MLQIKGKIANALSNGAEHKAQVSTGCVEIKNQKKNTNCVQFFSGSSDRLHRSTKLHLQLAQPAALWWPHLSVVRRQRNNTWCRYTLLVERNKERVDIYSSAEHSTTRVCWSHQAVRRGGTHASSAGRGRHSMATTKTNAISSRT